MKFLMALITVFGLQIANAKEMVVNTKDSCSMFGTIDEKMFNDIVKCKSNVVVIISSGGYVSWGNKIAEAIKGKTLMCHLCQSMAAIIFTQHDGPRYVKNNNSVMFHEIFTFSHSKNGKITMHEALQIYKNLKETNLEIAKKFKGISSDDYLLKIFNKDWYPTLEEIKRYKLADGVFQ